LRDFSGFAPLRATPTDNGYIPKLLNPACRRRRIACYESPNADKNHAKNAVCLHSAVSRRHIARAQWRQLTVKNWLHRKLLDSLLVLLTQGISPNSLALCVAIGVVVGNIPVLGVSTIICTIVALIFRLNLPAIQLVQAAMAPTQLLLIIPFVRLGEWIMRTPAQAVSIKAAFALMAQGIWHSVIVLKDAILHASVAWALIAPFSIYLIYRLLTPLFQRAAAELLGQR
jgi:uncharacterized protein (DUF2062 family)